FILTEYRKLVLIQKRIRLINLYKFMEVNESTIRQDKNNEDWWKKKTDADKGKLEKLKRDIPLAESELRKDEGTLRDRKDKLNRDQQELRRGQEKAAAEKAKAEQARVAAEQQKKTADAARQNSPSLK
ncbi:MAG: hypothetical protein WCI76_01980, partial [bacterium]